MEKYQLPEENGHVVTFFVYGNPTGVPIINFHGGPGSKSKQKHAELFNLKKYKVVLFDQRGCGMSSPLGQLTNNTTQDILHDAERIRGVLEIPSWFVSGGSWGATLSLLYAIERPEYTRGLLLTSLFLADKDTKNWSFGEGGASKMLPDVWERRMNFFKEHNIKNDTQNEDILNALENSNEVTQKKIVAGVFNWEGNLLSPHNSVTYIEPEDLDQKDIASAKIFTHYEMNNSFIPDNYILQNIQNIKDVPTILVHGRYDILCPMESAKKISDEMSACELIVATSSGHKLTAEAEMLRKVAFKAFLERQLS